MSMVCARFVLHYIVFLAVILPGLASVQSPAYASGLQAIREIRGIAVSELPPEGRETLRLIRQGGPFPYVRDGTIFRNFENILPKQDRGYYTEFTVRTPGVRNRGARRIVCGKPVECYYSTDHYQSFQRIME